MEDTMTVALAGEYDLSNTEELERALATVAGEAEVCVDLAAVEFLDCVALGVILTAVHDARARGAAVLLRQPRPLVRRMLEVSGAQAFLAEVPA
jgi:anti-sigma B factor antagonist